LFFFVSKLFDVFLSPYTWALGLLALAIPWRRPRRRAAWRWRRATGAVGLGLLLFFSLEPVSDRLLYALEHETTSTYDPAVTYDAVILLGGVVSEAVTAESGQPALRDTVERLIKSHELLMDGHARYVIISSAARKQGRIESSETRVLARQMIAWGADPSRILLEEEARNTYENALYSQRIARERGFGKVLVVTSAFHMKRAEECFAAVGMTVDTLLVDYRARRGTGFRSQSWLPRVSYLADSTESLREMAGLYVYRFRGYARPVR
jgi:uncharacterized SAM-binding protein YcdF (DUF218 family)